MMKTAAAVCAALFAICLPLSAKDGEIPSPEETVRTLYTEHIAGKGVLEDKSKRNLWDFVFSEDLVKALKADGRGFDPLLFAQDAEIKNLKVKEIDKDERGKSLVLVTFTNFGEAVRLVVSLHHTDHGHRIDNIIDPVTGVDLIHDLASGDE